MRKCKACAAEFEAKTKNNVYCSARCKRNEENKKRRLTTPLVYDAETWELEEQRKDALLAKRMAKNEWILQNKTFAMFDVEAGALDADFGRLICACIRPLGGPTKALKTRKGDAKIAVDLRNELAKYDYIVTWYGTGYDIPFLAARLATQGLPPIGPTRHVDMYYTARSAMKFASNRQAEVTKSFFGVANRTPVIGATWIRAIEGEKQAIQDIVDHCIADVQDLEDVFMKLVPYRNLSATPLRVY